MPTARRLIDVVRAEDPTRPVVMGADQYRSVPATGSVVDQLLRMHDGMGLNYNTATSIDGLHAKYPDKFFFESESSSQTSTRGQYDQPEQLNTGENHTPGRRWRPATGVHVDGAADTNQPTRITFDAVTTTAVRLDMTSSHPQAANGFIGITELIPLTP